MIEASVHAAPAQEDVPSPATRARGAHVAGSIAAAASVAALMVILLAQILGPGDLFHQTQPRTISYTADMLLHDRWILPREQGTWPATKPPLYNWIAAPFVWVTDFGSEPAHKMPSILALIACWGLAFWIGSQYSSLPPGAGPGVRAPRSSRAVGEPSPNPLPPAEGVAPHGLLLGGLGSLFFISTYTTYKLGYLARPDMLLTLFLALAWWSCTCLILKERAVAEETSCECKSRLRPLRIVFWSAVALSLLAKGPVGLLPLVYAPLAAAALRGSWREARVLGWRIGLPLALAPFAAWVIAALFIDAGHVMRTLVWDEFLARIVGTGSESGDAGAWALLTGIFDMPYYFLVRSAPWSVLAIAGILMLVLRTRSAEGEEIARSGCHGFGRGATNLCECNLDMALEEPEDRKVSHGLPSGRSRGTEEVLRATSSFAHAAESRERSFLVAAALWMGLLIAIFTLSAGKRADYIASVYLPSSLLAAWALLRIARNRMAAVACAVIAASVTVAVLIAADWREVSSPFPRSYGESLDRFATLVRERIEEEPTLALAFWRVPDSHLQTLLGQNEPHTTDRLIAVIRAKRRCWLLVGDRPGPDATQDDFEHQAIVERFGLVVKRVLSSEEVEGGGDWPRRIILYHVERPRRGRLSTDE